MDPGDAGNGAHSGDEPRSTSATPRTSRVVKREISTVSRASSQRRIAPGPSLLSRQPSAGNNLGTTSGKSFDGGLQSLSRTNSVKRVQSHVREKTGGLALSLVQQKATYSRPLSPEHHGDDVHLSTNGLHAGVCPNCRVSIDSTILQDAQTCAFDAVIRETCRVRVVTERRAEKKAETSLGISSTKRSVAERHEYNKWQETLSGAMSNTDLREAAVHNQCCICLLLTFRSINPIETNPVDPRAQPGHAKTPLKTSNQNSTPASLEQVYRVAQGSLTSLPSDCEGCPSCASRYRAMMEVKSMFDDDEGIRSNLVAGLGQGSKHGAPTFEEASVTLLKLYRAYMGSGPICKALLDADLDVAGLIKKARAVLASSDQGVAWFASSWIDSLVQAKGALDISRCELVEVADLTPLGSHLKFLDVSYNHTLERLPVATLCSMKSLTGLKCAGCRRLLSPPPEIARLGSPQVMEFLRSVTIDGKLNTEVLFFTIGDGESGKTSTVRALMSSEDKCGAIAADDRTVGVDITPWKPQIGDGELKYLMFDMAGQSVYAVTHQYFLAERAVYMLVWRARDMNEGGNGVEDSLLGVRNMIEKWTDMLQNRVPGVPIVLVVTHIDCVTARELAEQVAWVQRVAQENSEKITLLNDGISYRINCRSGEGVPELREAVVGFTIHSRGYKEALPGTWIHLKEKLLQLQQDGEVWLPTGKYRSIARDCGVDGVNMVVATRFLHETGAIRFFGDASSILTIEDHNFDEFTRTTSGAIDMLEHTVFISAPWMVSVLKGLVRHERGCLLEYFSGNRQMSRRAQRLVVHGMLHKEITYYLWPASEAAAPFWDKVKSSKNLQSQEAFAREAAMWDTEVSGDIVKTSADISRALSLLQGFNMITPVGNGEYAVPTLISRERRTGIDERAFSNSDCPFHSSYDMATIPPGFVEGIAVRLWRQVSHADYSPTSAAFYSRGAMAQMFVQERTVNGLVAKKGYKLHVRASNRRFLRLIKSEVNKMAEFFPGMPQLRAIDHDQDTAGVMEPAEVLILSSKGTFRPGSQVHIVGCPIVEVDPDLFLDSKTRLEFKLFGIFGPIIRYLVRGFHEMFYLHSTPRTLNQLKALDTFLESQCFSIVQKLAPAPIMPPVRHFPKISAVSKILGMISGLACTKNTVASSQDHAECFWWMRSGVSAPSSKHGHEMDLLCSTTHPGPRFSDVTHFVDCAMAIELEHIISEVFGQFVSNALIEILSYMSGGKVVERDVIGALKAKFGQDVSHRTREMDTYTDILAEVGSELLAETLAQVLEHDIESADAVAEIQEVFPGKEWLESSDGKVLVRTTLPCGSEATMGGQLTASFHMDQIYVFQDVSRADTIFDIGVSMWPSVEVGKMLIELGGRSDKGISNVELSGPDRHFGGQARVVLVMVDSTFHRSKECIEIFKKWANSPQGVAIIPLIMPGFEIKDYSHWWPKTMEEMSAHALFVDMRNSDDWSYKISTELMPQIVKFLEEWRGTPPAAASAGLEDVTVSVSTQDEVDCTVCFLSGVDNPYKFKRNKLELQHRQWIAEKLARMGGAQGGDLPPTPVAMTPKHRGPLISHPLSKTASQTSGKLEYATVHDEHLVTCGYGHNIPCTELLSISFVRESIPCVGCTQAGQVPPFCFERKSLLLYFSEENTNKVGTVSCQVCMSAGREYRHRILDILTPEVFLSYNWGRKVVPPDGQGTSYFATQRLVTSMQRRIEMEADITCWLDVAGGMGAGQSIVKEMLEGVQKSSVFVLFLADAYIVSKNCRLEIKTAIKSCKYIVPVLISGEDGQGLHGYNDGWTGTGDADPQWWRHAKKISIDAEEKGLLGSGSEKVDVSWSALAQFTPIDVREDKLEDGALSIESERQGKILNRILSRLHRGEYIQHMTNVGYEAWRRAKHKLLEYMANSNQTDEKSDSAQSSKETKPDFQEDLRRVFQLFDTDGSGAIDQDELMAALNKLGVMVSEDEVVVMMRQADIDGNGEIDVDEFVSIFIDN